MNNNTVTIDVRNFVVLYFDVLNEFSEVVLHDYDEPMVIIGVNAYNIENGFNDDEYHLIIRDSDTIILYDDDSVTISLRDIEKTTTKRLGDLWTEDIGKIIKLSSIGITYKLLDFAPSTSDNSVYITVRMMGAVSPVNMKLPSERTIEFIDDSEMVTPPLSTKPKNNTCIDDFDLPF